MKSISPFIAIHWVYLSTKNHTYYRFSIDYPSILHILTIDYPWKPNGMALFQSELAGDEILFSWDPRRLSYRKPLRRGQGIHVVDLYTYTYLCIYTYSNYIIWFNSQEQLVFISNMHHSSEDFEGWGFQVAWDLTMWPCDHGFFS